MIIKYIGNKFQNVGNKLQNVGNKFQNENYFCEENRETKIYLVSDHIQIRSSKFVRNYHSKKYIFKESVLF